MRQSDYQITKRRHRPDIWMCCCYDALENEMEDSIVYKTLHKATIENETVVKLKVERSTSEYFSLTSTRFPNSNVW